MSCSPFCLNATLDFHVRQYYKENIDMAEKVIGAFYIDDWSCAAANGEEAVELFKEVKSCLAAGSFNLRKWATNDEEVASKIAAYNREIVCKSEEEVDQMENVSFAKMSMGGYYERMVQLMKRILRKILGRARLDFEELTTVIAEVEGTINSRPLAYLNPEDFEEPLTPAHLVIGRRILTLNIEEDEYDANIVEKRARYLRTLLGHFWRRWSNEYLLSLREHHHSRVKKGKR